MTIQEVSKRYGLTQDTLRYYERVGMIPPVHRGPNGMRDYTGMDLKWVELARCMRSAGMHVEAIVEYVRLFREGSGTVPQRLALLRQQRELLREQQLKINEMLNRLDQKIEKYESGAFRPKEENHG